MTLPGRKLLLGLCVLIAMVYAIGLPRLWHAHSSADLSHEHGTITSSVAHRSHDHLHGHHHSHSHRHSHGHSHPHSHHHHATHEDDRDENAAIDQHHAAHWHLHVSLFGWTLTIWGAEAAPQAGRIALAQQDDFRPAVRTRRSLDPVEVETTAVSAVEFDWLANWDVTLNLIPSRRSGIDLPFDPSQQFAGLENDSLHLATLQPPVPPPRSL